MTNDEPVGRISCLAEDRAKIVSSRQEAQGLTYFNRGQKQHTPWVKSVNSDEMFSSSASRQGKVNTRAGA